MVGRNIVCGVIEALNVDFVKSAGIFREAVGYAVGICNITVGKNTLCVIRKALYFKCNLNL